MDKRDINRSGGPQTRLSRGRVVIEKERRERKGGAEGDWKSRMGFFLKRRRGKIDGFRAGPPPALS